MDRRSFVGITVAGAAASFPRMTVATVSAEDQRLRRDQVYARRAKAAEAARAEYVVAMRGNGDEALYASHSFVGSFAKGLPHEADGRVSPYSFESMVDALEKHDGRLLDFGASSTLQRLVAQVIHPSGELAGCDYTGIFVPPASPLASARTAADMIELYWLALTRDVPLARFDDDPMIAKACADLSRLTDFSAPREHGAVTPATIFRGPGRPVTGPSISQFLWLDFPVEMGVASHQRRSMPVKRDSLTDRASWLAAQSGVIEPRLTPRDGSTRYILTGRDLTDYLWQLGSAVAWRNAAAIIDALPNDAKTAAFNYDDIVGLIAFAASISGDAMIFQKMYVQRRARPEAVGGLVDRGPRGSVLHSDMWTTPALDLVRARYKTALLPQAYLEGSPTAPAYPSGHATLAGTGATVLKALVNESYELPDPMVPSPDGLRLVPYKGPPLTLGVELDKLAANCAFGRGTAGVHYRTDGDAGLRLGEAAALTLLRDRVAAIGNSASTYSLTTFDGTKVTIGPNHRPST